jgi:hypothetical protein
MVTRIQPNMPVQAYRTFEIRSPLTTHYRPATCAEAECEHYLNGWRVRVEGLSQEHLHAARTAGRRFVEQQVTEGETWLIYEPGQPCFAATRHVVAVGRPEIYLSRGGDWRGATTGPLTHSGPDAWLDEFQTNQDALTTRIDRG